MPTNIEAVVTDIGRRRLLEGWAQVGALAFVTYFKVGEGGWLSTPAGSVPRDPTDPGTGNNRGPTLVDLDCIANPTDYPVDSRATFTKALAALNFTVSGNWVTEATCLLDFLEFNDDGFGNFPEIYEVGLFNADDEMVAYGTCPRVDKNPGVQRTFKMRISASRS